MENKGLLIIIAVLLLGIFAVMLIEASQKSPEQRVAESLSQTVEEIGNQVRADID